MPYADPIKKAECNKASRARALADPIRRARIREQNRLSRIKWARSDQRNVLFHSAKYRAKKEGVPFDITREDIKIPDTCPVLGIKLSSTSKRLVDASITLDKIIPKLGYVRGNIMVISWRANRLKSNATIAEMEAIVRYMKDYPA